MTLLKQAIRQLGSRLGLSATVIAMLSLGIGATTAIFALFHQVLVQPLPVPEPERLVNVLRSGPPGRATQGQGSMSYPLFRDLEAAQSVFTGIAVHSPLTANLAHGDGALSLRGSYVSGQYFSALGLRPAHGRLISREDEPRPGDAAVVVLGYDLWQSRFGADAEIVGRPLTINGQRLTVIGVAPPGFAGTELAVSAQVFIPLTMRWRLEPPSPILTPENRNFTWLRPFARLRPGVSLEQAAAGLNTAYGRILREIEAPQRTLSDEQRAELLEDRLQLLPGERGQGSIPGAARSLTLLFGVTLLVLLIVCVNVANLLLMRGAARTGEMAIREAMGASRGRLVAQLCVETAVPAALGGALAVPVAAAILAAVEPLLPARMADGLAMEVGPSAAAFAAVATLASALACGLLPALRTARTGSALALKGHAPQALGGRAAMRLRTMLVAAQIGLSTVLLVLAGLFAQSLLNVARIDLGMDVDSLVSFTVAPRLNGYDRDRTAAVYSGIERALAAQPGVTGVTTAAIPVIAGADIQLDARMDGAENGAENGAEPTAVRVNAVGPAFFATLGIPLLAGRELGSTDAAAGSPPVVIVNERFTRLFDLAGGAIGRRVDLGSRSFEIVGVVANAAYDAVKDEVPPQLFVPRFGELDFSLLGASATFYVRTAIGPDVLLTAIPTVVAQIDPTLPVSSLTTMRRQARENVFVDRLVTMLSASFAVLATLLAAVGLYAVLAYDVVQRTRELGLRLALGAEPASLRSMVLQRVAWVAVIGIGIGLVVAAGVGRAAQALLFGLSSSDPVALAGAAAVLTAVVLAASYWPARRASLVAPMEALRHE